MGIVDKYPIFSFRKAKDFQKLKIKITRRKGSKEREIETPIMILRLREEYLHSKISGKSKEF